MRNNHLVFALASVLLWVPTALAEDLQSQMPNGCGPQGYGWAVPDNSIVCSFTKACNAHDICYSRCAAGGDLFGKATCTDQKARSKRRQSCDVRFYEDMVNDNQSRLPCRFYAAVYRIAVESGGEGSFNGFVVNEKFAAKYGDSEEVLLQLEADLGAASKIGYLQESTTVVLDVDSSGQPLLTFEDPAAAKRLSQEKGVFSELRYGDVVIENPMKNGVPVQLNDLPATSSGFDRRLLNRTESYLQ